MFISDKIHSLKKSMQNSIDNKNNYNKTIKHKKSKSRYIHLIKNQIKFSIKILESA